jgi:outer membrane protein assembly factor BamE (lipoprotein component of BamABCDE complex)
MKAFEQDVWDYFSKVQEGTVRITIRLGYNFDVAPARPDTIVYELYVSEILVLSRTF